MINKSRMKLAAIGVASFASLVTWTAHGKSATQARLVASRIRQLKPNTRMARLRAPRVLFMQCGAMALTRW